MFADLLGGDNGAQTAVDDGIGALRGYGTAGLGPTADELATAMVALEKNPDNAAAMTEYEKTSSALDEEMSRVCGTRVS